MTKLSDLQKERIGKLNRPRGCPTGYTAGYLPEHDDPVHDKTTWTVDWWFVGTISALALFWVAAIVGGFIWLAG